MANFPIIGTHSPPKPVLLHPRTNVVTLRHRRTTFHGQSENDGAILNIPASRKTTGFGHAQLGPGRSRPDERLYASEAARNRILSMRDLPVQPNLNYEEANDGTTDREAL